MDQQLTKGHGESELFNTWQLCKTPDLIVDIKMRKFGWLRHVIRIDQTGVAKTIFQMKPKVTRKEDPDLHGWKTVIYQS
jgi:hypothetical protein